MDASEDMVVDLEAQDEVGPRLKINIDKFKMEQVVRNFLTNALKFTTAGSGTIQVNMMCREAGDELAQYPPFSSHLSYSPKFNSTHVFRLEVIDNGAGISAVSVIYILLLCVYRYIDDCNDFISI